MSIRARTNKPSTTVQDPLGAGVSDGVGVSASVPDASIESEAAAVSDASGVPPSVGQ
jgi:hypothetical protein